jgi:hypothetical protein
MITAIYIGTERLDLFKDESIVITSKVTDIEDITKIFTDTSNSFNVPASDINNRVFKHYYNANIIGGFDARKKKEAVIELNGINYKVGKMRLNNVKLKGNKPSSYDIDFFGSLVSLKDALGDDKLVDLDLSAYNFSYSYSTVLTKLKTEGDLIFSFFSSKRYIYDSSNQVANNDNQTNVYYNGTDGNSGADFTEAKGSFKNIRIIEAIEANYDLTFSRDFFGGNEFSELYMLLSGFINNEYEEQIHLSPSNDPSYAIPAGGTEPVLLYDDRTDTVYVEVRINQFGAGITAPYTIIVKSDGVVIYEDQKSPFSSSSSFLYPSDFNSFKKLTFHIKSAENINYIPYIIRDIGASGVGTDYISGGNGTILGSDYDVASNLPDMTVVDYLKSLFKLYKLVAIVQKDGSVYVDSLNNYYRKGQVHEITKFVDNKELKISRGKILKEINYNFEEPTTILNKEFENNNDIAYGDLELKILDSNGQPIDGDDLDYEVKFEQIVYERLIDINGVDSVNFQYALLQDESLNPVKPKAHIHYNYNTTMSSPIKLLQPGGSGFFINQLNMPMHTLGINAPVFSTVFGEEFNEYNGNLISETIFKTHHQKYIEGVFSEKRRVYDYKAKNLPQNIINGIELNDVLLIKEDYYRIDSMKVNIITGDVEFKLINEIDLDLMPLV